MAQSYTKAVDIRISHMIEALRRYRFEKSAPVLPFITISREYGCRAFEVATALATRFNEQQAQNPPWAVYDRNLVEKVAGDFKVANRLVESMTTEHRGALEEFLNSQVLKIPSQDVVFKRMSRVIRSLAWHGNAIIIGRGGAHLCRDLSSGVHVRLNAPFYWRLERYRRRYPGEDREEVRKQLIEMDRERRRFYEKHFGSDHRLAHDFDLEINDSRFTADQIVSFVLTAMRNKGFKVN